MSHVMRFGSVIICSVMTISCADTKEDASRPAPATHKSMTERLNEGGGYKQTEDGSWVPKSDKRSSFDSQRESPYFKGKVDKETYKTGDYAKKTWWGGDKDFARKSYGGNTDGSRFQKAAMQDGSRSRSDGQTANLPGPFKTNTLDRKNARESRASSISRPADAAVQSQRDDYKAPSVIDWREQRRLSMDQSRGILGR